MSKKPTHTEKQLLKAIRLNGDSGWEQLIFHFEPMIMKIVAWKDYHFTADVQEDVRQNIYIHLRKAIPRFRGDSTLAYYIKRIAKNECINEIRRQCRLRKIITFTIQKTPDAQWDEEDGADINMMDALETLLLSERKETVHEAVNKLNSTCRDSISLFYFEQKTYCEISEQLGITQNTVGSRLSKCLDKLHHELKKLPLFARSES